MIQQIKYKNRELSDTLELWLLESSPLSAAEAEAFFIADFNGFNFKIDLVSAQLASG